VHWNISSQLGTVQYNTNIRSVKIKGIDWCSGLGIEAQDVVRWVTLIFELDMWRLVVLDHVTRYDSRIPIPQEAGMTLTPAMINLSPTALWWRNSDDLNFGPRARMHCVLMTQSCAHACAIWWFVWRPDAIVGHLLPAFILMTQTQRKLQPRFTISKVRKWRAPRRTLNVGDIERGSLDDSSAGFWWGNSDPTS